MLFIQPFSLLLTQNKGGLLLLSAKSNGLDCMKQLKSSAATLVAQWLIVTLALSPIDTSGYVPGEGQIFCRIKLIYQMI